MKKRRNAYVLVVTIQERKEKGAGERKLLRPIRDSIYDYGLESTVLQ